MTTEPENNINTRIYYISTIFALLIWSSSFIGTKIAYTTFTPITLGAVRFVLASVVLGIVLIIKKEFIKPTVKDLSVMSLSGVLGITMYFTLENTGVNLTTASNAALIVASFPAITALLELIIYRIKTSKQKLFGIFLAMSGVYILSQSGNSLDAQNQLVGNISLIGAGFVWAFYNFMTRKVVNKYPAITLSFYQTIAGTIFFIPLAFTERQYWQPPTALSTAMLIYLGVFCSVIAFLLYNFGLRKLSSGTSVSLMNLVPIFGVIFSVLILQETVSFQQLIGGGIVIFGVLLSVKQKKNISVTASYPDSTVT